MNIHQSLHRILLILGVFSLILIVSAYSFYATHKSHELGAFVSDSRLELNFLKKGIKNTLQRGHYQDAIQLVKEWGELNANIYSIRLTSENGFIIAQYQRELPTDNTIINSDTISYSYRGHAKLQIIHDLSSVYLQLTYFALKLGFVTFIGIFAFWIFTYQFLLLQRRNKELGEEARRLSLLQKELSNSEQLLQNVIVGANLGFWDWYYQTGEYCVSDRWLSILGLKRSEIKNNIIDLSRLIHEDDKPVVNQEIDRAIEEDIPYRVEFRMQHKNGSWVWIEGSGCVIERDGETDSPLRLCGTHQDITERKQQEELLRRTQKMNALGKLTGGVAHDFNNILGVITGYSELLKIKLKDQPHLAKYAHELGHASLRGVKLTKKLLTFSSGKSADAVKMDINAVLQDNHQILEKTLTVRINLVFDLADELWPVKLDSSELEDVILNMSINAMHAINGNGQLTIQTRNMSIKVIDAQHLDLDAGDYVQLSFTDTGCGIDDVIKEKIFDPFFTTKGDRGTGLGLTQVYGFVKRSGGMIKVYSESGHGTQFVFYFPRFYASDPEDKPLEVDETVDLSGSETILVVDDEQALLNLNYEILNQWGYIIICAASARQALEILKKKSIDLMMSDVIMPEQDGYQLAEEVQKKYPAVKILMVSGFSDNRHVNMDDKRLHQNLLHKPYTSQILLKKIRELLDQ